LTEILPKIPLYNLFRLTGFPRLLPLNLTLGLTYRCNSRCKSCRIYEKQSPELSLTEWEKIFTSIGKAPYWFTLSGGEPFLVKDLVEICRAAYRICRPGIINIPTNGLLVEAIPEMTAAIARDCPNTQIIINLSIDEIGEQDDDLRGVKSAYTKALETYRRLSDLKSQFCNLNIGIHTVISRFNVQNFPQIYRELIKLQPDSYITEIAEERIELGTIGSGITPEFEDYSKAIDYLIDEMKKQHLKGISKITRAFRLKYYEMVKRVLLEKNQIYPCFAGFASAQIAPNGELWFCCIRAESVGNLREYNYDFKKAWFSQKARNLRKHIKNKECYCPLANASYTNMLLSFPTLAKVAGEIILS